MKSLIVVLLVFSAFISTALGLTCYSSNGQSRNENDNGYEYECKEAAKANRRTCLKFKTDSRPGKVFRECDHVFEQLFTYDVFDVQGNGCWNFDTVVTTKSGEEFPEKGIYCACDTDRCNGGAILDSDVTP